LTAGDLKHQTKGDSAATDSTVLDSAAIAALHRRHADELRYFILGVVRDHDLTAEVVQTAFTRAIELGHTVKQESLKAWLFRVAYNEALAVRRRQAVGERAMRFLADQPQDGESGPEAGLVQGETVAAVRAALESLPVEQRQVVALRIYEQKRFAEIAKELSLPLGTVLSRMHLALSKLRRSLPSEE
jgi:RNA polymerase sigma-70 factor (ECF subfamily)